MRLTTFCCDGCGDQYTEKRHGEGAPGWCGLKGVMLEDDARNRGPEEPVFCPECKKTIIAAVETLRDHNGMQ